MKDLKTNLAIVAAIVPATHKADVDGSAADLSLFESALVRFQVGEITDGTHTPAVEACDDNATWAAVPASDLKGTLAPLADNTPQTVAYVGTKRYIRPVVVVTGAPVTGGVYGAEVIRGHGRYAGNTDFTP